MAGDSTSASSSSARSLEPSSADSAREQGREPTSEEREPPVFEHGLNNQADIADALDVEELDVDLYRSKTLWTPARARGVFGGQVIGQAVAASNSTVKEDVKLHSLHAYFLLPGNKDIPVYYHVTRVRDGGSYVTRLVTATQRGRSIFTIMLSYQRPEPSQPTFHIKLPQRIGTGPGARIEAGTSSLFVRDASGTPESLIASIAPPEECPLNEERYLRVLHDERGAALPAHVRAMLEGWVRDRQQSAVEIRDALPDMYDEHGIPTPGHEQAFWMRTRKPVAGGEEAQKVALAYASDFYLLSTVPKALGNSRVIKMMASLDHSMWLYHPFDVSEWTLFLMQTQAAAHGRGVSMGRIYRRDGLLVAVVAQEGLVRGKVAKL